MVSESIEIVTVVFRLVEKREGPADAQLVAPEAAVPVERVGEGGPAFADVLGKGAVDGLHGAAPAVQYLRLQLLGGRKLP